MKKPIKKTSPDDDTIFPEHEGGITGELTPEELKMVLAEILREDNEYDKYAHLFRSIMKNSGSFIMNRKLASVASSLSDKFGNLSREYALKSLVEEVTLEVVKNLGRSSEEEYDRADYEIKEIEENSQGPVSVLKTPVKPPTAADRLKVQQREFIESLKPKT